LLTPMQLSHCLLAIYQDGKIYKVFKNSLPINGKRGTLSNRMKSPLMIKRVIAKTGKLRDVSSLSGFVKAKSRKQYIFSIITNNHDLGYKAGRRMESGDSRIPAA
jgi:serine-type D-Ala-D-Ala carboxypeptidase/endopeptidase (penicillin-binding protein 4)